MPFWENYHVAATLQDALDTASHAPGPARFVAGGTDLLLDIQQGRHPAVHTLVDVTGLAETRALELRGSESDGASELFVGGAVPLSRIVTSPLVIEHARALSEAAALIGGSQVRNTATLGGNVAHALPAADGSIALLALGAQAEVADVNGCRRVALSDLFLGPGRSSLDPRSQVLVGFYLPVKGAGQGSAHRRVMRPQGVAIAILNMAVWLQRAGETISDLRIALGPAGPVPVQARRTVAFLRGKVFETGLARQAVETLLSEASFRTSPHRSTAEYRHHLARVLLEETLQMAWERSG